MISIYKKILLVLSILHLLGCSPECIDPDDFGFPKLYVSSQGNVDINGSLTEKSRIIKNDQDPGDQIMIWQDSGYVITGARLVILVRNGNNSRWSFLYGTANDRMDIAAVLRPTASVCTPGVRGVNWTSPNNIAQEICLEAPSIKDKISTMNYSNSCPNASPNDTNGATGKSLTGSCYFNKGVGAYALITSLNPNASEGILRNLPDEGYESFHLGEDTNLFKDTLSGSMPPSSGNDDNYDGAGGYNEIPKSPVGSTLYFKILDHFYDDNAGGYQIIMKSGIEVPGLKPIAKVINFVETTFQLASQSIYEGEVQNSDLQRIIKTLLTLYIIIQAICFMFGLTQASGAQFAIHIFKMGIIFQLTSDTSWQFFNDTAFSFFTKGVNQMICIVTSGDSSGCTPQTAFNIFDDALGIVWSRETWKKAFSLFFVQIEGIILILLLLLCGIIFTIALFKAIILFLVAYLATSLLVILAPIFMPFMLFKATKHIFDNLISQFFNYFIQPIIVFASIGFWNEVIITQLQKLLGFKICTDTLWNFIPGIFFPRGVHVDPAKDLQWIYAPGVVNNPLDQNKIYEACATAKKVPSCSFSQLSEFYKDQFQQSGTLEQYQMKKVTFVNYEKLDLRFPDLPFLQPYIQEDWDRIQQIASGNYVTFFDLLLFAILIYLMYLFNNMVPEISRGLSGGGGYGADIGGVANNAFASIKKHTFDNVAIDTFKNKTKVGRAIRDKYRELDNRQKNFRAREIGGITSKVSDYTSPTKLVKKIPVFQSKGPNNIQVLQDKIGGKYDSAQALSKGLKDNALYKSSYGIMGKNLSEINQNTGRSHLDTLKDEYAHYHGIKGEKLDKLTTSVDTMSNSLRNIGRVNQIAMAVSIVNPFVGGMIGLVGTGIALKKAANARRDIGELSNDTQD